MKNGVAAVVSGKWVWGWQGVHRQNLLFGDEGEVFSRQWSVRHLWLCPTAVNMYEGRLLDVGHVSYVPVPVWGSSVSPPLLTRLLDSE